MLKFAAVKPDGRILIGVGLSQENLARLGEEPILADLASWEGDQGQTLGVEGHLLIVVGETEESLQRDLEALFGDEM